MSQKLISLSPDLKQLQDEGYAIEVKGGLLLIHNIPYVNSKREVVFGTLVSLIDSIAGDRTAKPQNHLAYFIGEHPCDKDGNPIEGIRHGSALTLAEGVVVNHSFSNKPPDGYVDYYQKVTTYIQIIQAHAQSIDRSSNARTYWPIETSDFENIFQYLDTNSSRARIGPISARLQHLKIAIVGLGGTGSYVLDFVSKTPVKEVHLFDGDDFLSHNAFRTPGAASLDSLRGMPKKVDYLHSTYSLMHKGIVPHDFYLIEEALGSLHGMDFVFMCIDDGESKRPIINELSRLSIPFIDVGIDVKVVDDSLMGSARITTVTPEKNEHISARISFANERNNDYQTNIQIAELNALNAALAVIKWKKLFGFYHDQEKEHNTLYDLNVNKLFNNETFSQVRQKYP
jgi:hypothetical protein